MKKIENLEENFLREVAKIKDIEIFFGLMGLLGVKSMERFSTKEGVETSVQLFGHQAAKAQNMSIKGNDDRAATSQNLSTNIPDYRAAMTPKMSKPFEIVIFELLDKFSSKPISKQKELISLLKKANKAK